MAATAPNVSNNLGFLSVSEEASGFVGGYLVTNSWGRPLEFRISSAVQPNRVQQILYGDTLRSYLCGEVIGKALVEKTATSVACVFIDQSESLEVRAHVAMPVAYWQRARLADEPEQGLYVRDQLYCHSRYAGDVGLVKEIAEKLGAIDFGEPFARIREAISEARKMGINQRRAA